MRIVICLPGANFTRGFFESWVKLNNDDRMKEHRLLVRTGYNSSVIHARNQLLEMENGCPKRQAKPLGGMPYDWMFWIDSDSVFEPDDFFTLLEDDYDITTGLVPIDTEGKGALGNVNDFKPVQYLNLTSVPRTDVEPWEIEFCGFAFVCVRYGVFESMLYPWFRYKEYPVDERIVIPGEDFEWCIRARELGWHIWADPRIRIGHEKQVIIQ